MESSELQKSVKHLSGIYFFFAKKSNLFYNLFYSEIWYCSYFISLFILLILFILQSTLYCSCFIWFASAHTLLFIFRFISFSPQSISFISSTMVYHIHISLIWLYSYYTVIQPYCQFYFSANPFSGN